MSNPESPLKLNLGAGSVKAEGWTSVDYYNPAADVKADLLQPLPWDDDTVDQVMMTHVIEHIPYRKHQPLFDEIWRILKPGGGLAISCPDFLKCVDAFVTNQGGLRWQWWIQTLYGSQEDEGQFHVAPITIPRITEQLINAGFTILRAETTDRMDIEVEARKVGKLSYFM